MSQETSKVLPLQQPAPSSVFQAQVVDRVDGGLLIDITGLVQPAEVAFSCLVQPEVGDLVLYISDHGGKHFILGIVSRPERTSMHIRLPGETLVDNAAGSLSFKVSESINFLAQEKINSVSDEVLYKSNTATVDYGQLTARGEDLQASFGRISLVTGLISTLARQVINRCKSYIRQSQDSDQVKTAQMSREVSGLYSMDSKYTIMVSKKDTKIDGERIHMG